MVSGFVASVQRKEIAGSIVEAKVRHSQRLNDPLVNIGIVAEKCKSVIVAEKCPSQLSGGKIFWKLLIAKQQTGTQDLATVHLF